ncbi:helix-turn-helix domain-containing protein [Xylocopilactobacillus apicola]|uniref:Insertion element IS150 protein InsJ-like helix-turn-helix domain-containing protein n=1 Tax=Xylocopilactobacillus apicola TaxID=2932184 RepID=A0AAU9DR46_9LACO|nr:helix-turn-helix domain-containing protein [Xylocopilactobacillus apicola]BDR59682.1 hypothetical protein XA3_21230 [Xylocopilactobacillus apicola]
MSKKFNAQERMEVINWTVEHDKNYNEAIRKFGCTYQQVYTWVKRYEELGDEGLVDHRHEPKSLNNPEIYKLQSEIKDLKNELDDQKIVKLLEKKSQPTERRDQD